MEKLPTVKLMEGTGKYVQMSVKSVDTKEDKILVCTSSHATKNVKCMYIVHTTTVFPPLSMPHCLLTTYCFW